ncbi:MAG: ATP-binding protein [Myxococcota bacterium]
MKLEPAPADSDPWLAERFRRQKWLSWLTAACWAAFVVSNLLRGRTINTIIDAAACVATLAAWAWASRAPAQRLTVCSDLVLLASSLALASAGAVGGQSRSVALWYLVAVPLVAAYSVGVRSALQWVGVCVALYAGVHVVELSDAVPQEFVPAPAEILVGRTILMVLLAAYAISARRAADLHVAALRAQEQLARAQAEAVSRQAAELALARDEALAAARAKSAFLAAMSHEVRTPLNAIIGMAEMLGRGPLTEEQRRMLSTAERAGRALVAVVDDVLQFSKLEAGGGQSHAAPFNLTRCVDDVVALFEPLARERGLQLRIQRAHGVAERILGDEQRLRQVLVNLVANAIKFTDVGEVTVTVGPGPAGVQFEVRDTGIGIDPAGQAQLFTPFTQLDNGLARRRGGTGLGLAISRRLVELMGGTIQLESTPGAGSTFRFSIPAPPAPDSAPEPQPSEEPTESRPPLRVLLVDDNAANQLVLVSMLEHLGYRPDVAESGHDALAAIRERRYDVVLMDMQMPEMDGLEATRQLHAMLPREEVPWVVALTANVLDEQRAQCLAAGMHDFLAKPVDLRTLAEALKRAPRRSPHEGRAEAVSVVDRQVS